MRTNITAVADSSPISATVVVLTRAEGREVFLIKRSAQLRFLPGYWAFPGGAVDPVDHRAEAPAGRALARSAARELFEETGVLVPGLSGAPERAAMLQREPDLAAWCALTEDVAWLDAWQQFAEVVTPRFSLRRFRAHFFHLDLPAGEATSIIEGELVDGQWCDPATALSEWEHGELLLAPPALYILRRLVGQSLADALSESTRSTRAVREGRVVQQAEHAPGVIALPLTTHTLPPATTTNTYLLGIERFFCVDPATHVVVERELLFDEIARRIAAGHEFAGVLVTHHHSDHTASVQATAERFGVPVLAHAETFTRVGFGDVTTRELTDGERLKLGSKPRSSEPWNVTVLHTPGHAPGHLVFVEDHLRSAIVGDLVSTLSTIVIDPVDGDMAQYLASLARVRDFGIGILFPAHGMPAPLGEQKLNAYIEHRHARETKLQAALTDELQTPTELVPLVYDDADPRIWGIAELSLRAGLLKLQAEGKAHESRGRWALRASAP